MDEQELGIQYGSPCLSLAKGIYWFPFTCSYRSFKGGAKGFAVMRSCVLIAAVLR